MGVARSRDGDASEFDPLLMMRRHVADERPVSILILPIKRNSWPVTPASASNAHSNKDVASPALQTLTTPVELLLRPVTHVLKTAKTG